MLVRLSCRNTRTKSGMLEIRCSVTKLVTGDVGTNESSGVTIGIRSTDRCVYEDQRDRDGARYRAPELRDRDLCQGFEHAILAELEAGHHSPGNPACIGYRPLDGHAAAACDAPRATIANEITVRSDRSSLKD